MILNALNGVLSNNCILQITTQQKLLKLTEILSNNVIGITAFGYENKVKCSISMSKKKKKSENKHIMGSQNRLCSYQKSQYILV